MIDRMAQQRPARPSRPGGAPVIIRICQAVASFALLLCATLLAYLPALRGGLLWDDNMHVTRADLRSLHGLWRIWFDLGATQQYYPLLHSAFWLEHRIWGDAVLGYHLINVVLHAASACPGGDDRPAPVAARRVAGRLRLCPAPGLRGGGGVDLGAEEHALRRLLSGGRAHLPALRPDPPQVRNTSWRLGCSFWP